MARDFVRSASDRLELASGIVTDQPLTLAAWINTDSLVLEQGILGIFNSATLSPTFRNIINIALTNAAQVRLVHRGVALNAAATTTATVSANTWHHVAGVVAGLSSRAVYLDGANKVSSTTTVDATSGIDLTRVGSNADTAEGMQGIVSSALILDIAASDAEIALLAKGIPPWEIFAYANIKEYWSLTRDLLGVRGNVLTATGTTIVADSGRVTVSRPEIPLMIGAPPITSTFASTLADSAMSASGSVANPITSTFASTLADSAMSAEGTIPSGLIARRSRRKRINLFAGRPGTLFPDLSNPQDVRDLVESAILVGGLAAEMARPYRDMGGNQSRAIQSLMGDANYLRSLLVAYQARAENLGARDREREEEEMLLL